MRGMHRVRLFVLWIMMFAVPFQGYAAAAMVLCGPGHSGATSTMTATSTMAAVTAGTSEAHDSAVHRHGDGHAGQHHHEAKQSSKADPGKTAGLEVDTLHKCGTCGACHGTALVSELQLAVLQDLPPAELAEPTFALAALVPRLLDKPPRR